MNRDVVTSLLLLRRRVAEASLDDVFAELQRALEACGEEDGGPVTVLTSKPPYVLHVNGYLRTVRACVSRVMKRYKKDLAYHVQPDSFSKMLVSVVITPRLNRGHRARFVDGVAKFLEAPYKGRPVTWSRRLHVNARDTEERVGDQEFSVVPDVWHNSFYGWVLEEK